MAQSAISPRGRFSCRFLSLVSGYNDLLQKESWCILNGYSEGHSFFDRELEMNFAFSFAMPGIPFIYSGNEIGMRQLYDLWHVEGAYKPRAGARTPMQWSFGKNLVFSTADSDKLYLPSV